MPDPSNAPQVMVGSRLSAAPVARLAAGSAPERARPGMLAAFFERLGVRYDATPEGGDPIEIDLTVRGLPGMQIMSGRMQGTRSRRTREGSDPTEDVGLLVSPGGGHLVCQRGREVVLGNGDATLITLTDPLETVHRAPGRILVLRFPRPRLAPHLSAARDGFMQLISRRTDALRLLTSYVQIVRDQQTLASRDLQHAIVSHFYDLTALAVGATQEAAESAVHGGVRSARLHAIRQDIVQNLHDPALSVTALALRHGCTPRLIQKLFEQERTSLTEYLLELRLQHAHGRLTDPRYADAKITTIASDSGFGDVSYFNRVFRRRYGDTPSGVRALTRRASYQA